MADPANTRRANWNMTWGSAFGLMDDVDPALKLQMDPITTGTTGKIVLGHRIIGLEGTVKGNVREVTLARIRALACPWGVSGSSYSLTPDALNADLYSYAQQLILHPTDVAADTLTQDLTLLKAVPVAAYNLKRTGTADDVWSVEFMIYPDRAQLLATPPKLVFGYVGAPPA